MGIGSIHPPKWGRKPRLYNKNEAQTPWGRIFQVWGGFGGWEKGGRRFEFMGEYASTSLEVSHLVWEASASSNHFIQVAKHTLHERIPPPFMELIYIPSFDGWICSSMLINVPKNILNNFDTSETSPRQYALDLGIEFSPIFPSIWPSESFWRENQN